MPSQRPQRIWSMPYSAECVEGVFSEVGLPLYGVLGSSPCFLRKIGYSNECYVGQGSSSPLRPTRGGEREVRNVAEETPPRYCSSCRHELKPEDYLFCPKCGTPFMYPPPPPQPGAGAPGEPPQEQAAQGQATQGQAAQEQPAQRGWWRRHPILTGGLGIIVVLFVFIIVVGSLGGGGEENKKSASGGTASTDGLIVC